MTARASAANLALGAALIAALIAATPPARAGGLVGAAGAPRAIGRAGAGTVGDDGGAALVVNPAAIARRATLRLQLGVAFVDDTLDWAGDPDAPVARDRGAASALPVGAIELGVRCWVIGIAALTTAAGERALRKPGDLPARQLGNAFDYRYAGIAGSARRDTIAIGAARRLGDAVALGVGVAASRVAVVEQRRLWAGFSGREPIGDPLHDVDVTLSASGLTPSAIVGVLVAPPDSHLELAASIGYSRLVRTTGAAVAAGASSLVTATAAGASAQLDLHQPIVARVGARWLADRWSVELDGDLWRYADAAARPAWQLGGVRVTDASGVGVDLAALPSRMSTRTFGALRGAVDVELVDGFLWATAGYAYTTAPTDVARLSPTFGALAGHTAALGLEASAGGIAVTLGWARTWSSSRSPTATALALDNPFAAGDRGVALGSYSGAVDMIGVSIDAELGGD